MSIAGEMICYRVEYVTISYGEMTDSNFALESLLKPLELLLLLALHHLYKIQSSFKARDLITVP